MRDGDHIRTGALELEAREENALDAWRSDPAMETLVEQIVSDGFADKIMAADTSPELRLADVADAASRDAAGPLASQPRPGRPWGRIAAGLLLGAGLAGAGAYALDPGPAPNTLASVASSSESRDTEPRYAEPDALGRPQFREGGTPGEPIPEDLPTSVARIVSDYGADWGPAFKFHGAIVVARRGEIVSGQGFGWADADDTVPNTINTRYRLGLLTEQFTAAAVLQLRDRGDLSLDQPISRFVANYPRGEEITVGQLLRHTSGIPNYTALPYFHTWKDKPHTTAQLINRFSSLPLEFPPGTDFSPSNANYYLLGAVIAEASGMEFGDYVEQNLFAPAGMTQSTYGDAYDSGQQAHGRVWNDEEMLDPPDPIHMSVFGAAGALVSSPTDLVKWNTALHGGKILSESSLQEMVRADEHGYGYGLAVDHGYGQSVLSFPAAIDGFNGSMIYFEEDETTVLVLCNTEVVPASRIAQDVAMLVYGDEPERRREAHEVKIAPSTYARYVGTYRLTEDTWSRYAELTDPERFAMLQTVHVRASGDRLYFDVPGHGLTWMHPMGRGRFFFKDHSGNRVMFNLDETKDARGMILRSKNAAFAFTRR